MVAKTVAYTLVPSPNHTFPGHPENEKRFGYFDTFLMSSLADRLLKVDAPHASNEVISTVHPPAYLETLQQAAARGPGFVDYGDTYVTPDSYHAACAAVGGSLEVVKAVIEKRADSGFALVRPPGHHATATRAMGFCLINNIAVAARFAQSHGLQRVMIIDFDVHHGNGSQDIFEFEPDVIYLSTHQEGIYPGTGSLNEIGVGDGAGTTINIPLPGKAGNVAFRSLLERIMLPVAERFKPDILLVSAGFDAHWSDPLAGLQLSTTGFFDLGAGLVEIADSHCEGRIVHFLEGGYDPQALADNVRAILHSLVGDPPPEDRLGPAPHPEPDLNPLISNILTIHDL
jgi:acetoin utilization deacetylase AcuC-like enzyme